MSKLFSAIKSSEPEPTNPDRLNNVRALAKAARDLATEIESDTEHLSRKKTQLYNMTTKELPDLFSEYNISSLSLEPEGNYPGVDLESKLHYKAVLPKNEETGEVLPEGLDWLEKNKAGDLIKRVYTIQLPMDNAKRAKELGALLKKHKFPYTVSRTVPWTTLTSWVKEQLEVRKKVLPLDILGATVGKVVKMKIKKSEK